MDLLHYKHGNGDWPPLPKARAACIEAFAENAKGYSPQCSASVEGAPSLLNNADQSDSLLRPSETTSESLSSELVELDSDVFV